MKKFVAIVCALLLVVTAVCAQGAQETAKSEAENSGRVVVYSSHVEGPLVDACNAFMAKYPDITVEIVRLGGSEIFARLENEAANPLADIVWGAGVDTVDAYSQYLQPYVSVEDANIPEQFKDPEDCWYADSLVVYCNFYNKDLVGDNLPTSWASAADPQYKGKIAMANPVSSGSAFVQVCSMLFLNGTKENNYEEGWAFVEDMYKNLNGIIQSSSGNCYKMVADGEYAWGLTLEKSVYSYLGNENLGWCYASEGTAAVGEGIAVVKNCKNLKNAQLFVDFILSQECQQAQTDAWSKRSVRADVTPREGLPSLSEMGILDYDLAWATENNAYVKERWQEIVVNN